MSTRRDRFAVACAVRPRLTFSVILFVMTAAAWLAPTAPAVADDEEDCGGGVVGFVCDGIKSTPLGELASGLANRAQGAKDAIESFHPENILDSWAQALLSAITYLLTFIQATAERISAPAFDQNWWIQQYAVSFGLAMLLLPFMLMLVAAKMGGPEGSVSGVELMRQSGWRVVFVVPMISAAPAVLYSVQQVAFELTKTFASESVAKGHGAIGTLLKMFEDKAGDWGFFGGVALVILVGFFILITAVVLLLELMIAQWGLLLAGLLVPIAFISWVYPPWSDALRRLASVLFGLMFLPVMVFFFFWTIWSAFDSMLENNGEDSGLTLLLFIFVSLVMIAAFPLVGWWLLSLVAPDADGIDGDVRNIAPTPSNGDVIPQRKEKSVEQAPSDGDPGGRSGSSDDDERGGRTPSGGDKADSGASPGAGDDKSPGTESVKTPGGEESTSASASGGEAAGAEASSEAVGAGGAGAGSGAGAGASGGAAGAGAAGAATGGVAVAAYAAKEGYDESQASGKRAMKEGDE